MRGDTQTQARFSIQIRTYATLSVLMQVRVNSSLQVQVQIFYNVKISCVVLECRVNDNPLPRLCTAQNVGETVPDSLLYNCRSISGLLFFPGPSMLAISHCVMWGDFRTPADLVPAILTKHSSLVSSSMTTCQADTAFWYVSHVFETVKGASGINHA